MALHSGYASSNKRGRIGRSFCGCENSEICTGRHTQKGTVAATLALLGRLGGAPSPDPPAVRSRSPKLRQLLNFRKPGARRLVGFLFCGRMAGLQPLVYALGAAPKAWGAERACATQLRARRGLVQRGDPLETPVPTVPTQGNRRRLAAA
jgi:hypothetical protein